MVMGSLTELMTWKWDASELARYFWLSGLLGGFTTFSAFTLDFGLLVERGQLGIALIYAGTSVVLCLGGFMIGMKGTTFIVQML
jgi:CrcB protein